MPINNYKDFLNEAVSLPTAIEAVLPAGAPQISAFLNQITVDLPNTPDFPSPLPDLPGITISPPPNIEWTPITLEWD